MQWKCRDVTLELHAPPLAAAIMGILNVTPDSFSDGGLYGDADSALRRLLEMHSQGCAVADIGAQSTRPGHTAISAREEWCRLAPLMERLSALRLGGKSLPVISVDTYLPEVACHALESGAQVINDVSGLRDPEMRRLIAQAGAGCVIMHGEDITDCTDPVAAVRDFFAMRTEQCLSDGIAPECICLDCGIGFGKTREQEAILLERMGECRVHGLPLLAAASRKRIIAWITGEDVPPDERDEATHRIHLAAVRSGADMVRVHDTAGAYASLYVQE